MVTKKQRQRQLARQKWERQQTRRVEHRRRTRRTGIIIGAVVAVVAVIAGGVGLFLLLRDDKPAHAAILLPDPALGPARSTVVLADGQYRDDSRFAITYGDPSTFDHVAPASGEVSGGLDVVTKAAKAGLAPDSGTQEIGRPATSVIIEDVKVTTK